MLLAIQGDDGALGFIVNQPCADPAWVARDFALPPGLASRGVHRGGPVSPGMAWVLFDPGSVQELPRDHALLSTGLAISASAEAARELEAQTDALRALVLVGHLRWEPGELEEELAAGHWLSHAFDQELLFGGSDECWTHAACAALDLPRPWFGPPTFADA